MSAAQKIEMSCDSDSSASGVSDAHKQRRTHKRPPPVTSEMPPLAICAGDGWPWERDAPQPPISYYESGLIKSMGDESHGVFWSWGPGGDLLFQLNHLYGKRDGVCRSWSAGQLASESEWCRGVLAGTCRMWRPNGRLYQEIEYSDNEKDGVFRQWFANGQIQEQSLWCNGRRHGLTVTWFSNGRRETTSTWHHGKLHGELITCLASGTLETQGHYWNGDKHGDFFHAPDTWEHWEMGERVIATTTARV